MEVKAARAAVEQSLAECEAELKKLNESTGTPQGFIWWQSRILEGLFINHFFVSHVPCVMIG